MRAVRSLAQHHLSASTMTQGCDDDVMLHQSIEPSNLKSLRLSAHMQRGKHTCIEICEQTTAQHVVHGEYAACVHMTSACRVCFGGSAMH